MRALLSPPEMPEVKGMNMPEDFYIVAREPVMLGGMAYPTLRTQWKGMYDMGIKNVVCLCEDMPSYPHSPVRMLYAKKLENLHGGKLPQDPDIQEELVRHVVGIIVDIMNDGEGVVVHCIGGIGRTGTVIGCTLKAMGYPTDAIIGYLDRLNKTRGIKGWPESAWQAEMIKKF